MKTPKKRKTPKPPEAPKKGRPEEWSPLVLLSLNREVRQMAESRRKGNMDACRLVLKQEPWCNKTTITNRRRVKVSLKTFYNRFLQGHALAQVMKHDDELRDSLSSKAAALLGNMDWRNRVDPGESEEVAEQIVNLIFEEVETRARLVRKKKVTQK